MGTEETYENYPASTVAAALAFEFSIYTASAVIIAGLGLIWVAVYLALVVFMYFQVFSKGCRNCYYFGKTCFSGKGRVAALFFKKGTPEAFCNRKMTVADLIPDMLISLGPVIAGIVLMIMKFNWLTLSLVAVLLILAFPGNGFIRGKLACFHCKQRLLGCPAEQLFGKAGQKK